MKDKVYIVLALLGFAALVIVFVVNFDPQRESKAYSQGNFYSPPHVKINDQDAQDLYEEMKGSRNKSCPVTIMSQYTAGDGVWSPYGTNYNFILLKQASQESQDSQDSGSENKSELDNLPSDIGEDPLTISKIYGTDIKAPVPIIAPFNFEFATGCTNVNSPTKIVIEDNSHKYRLEFDKIANWFCAGTPGTEWTVKGHNGDEVKVKWEEHIDGDLKATEDVEEYHHYTIIGDTRNATITGGNSGSVIGYANGDTTVTCYKLKDKNATQIPLKEMYKTNEPAEPSKDASTNSADS